MQSLIAQDFKANYCYTVCTMYMKGDITMIQDDQNTTTSLDLNQIRQDIDSVDQQIQQLINRRAKLAEAVAKAKFASEENPMFYRPEREAQVLRNVMERNEGPLSDVTMARLFREIMSACLALEAPQSIAFLGPVGTYTHSAVLKHFGHDAVVRPLPTIDEVFREVEAGSAHYGLVPVENSSEGVERVALSSNAEAARRIRTEWHSAAIASDVAASIYDLEILHSNIEDNPENTTRFLVIGRERIPQSGNDKTSLLISAHDRAGALLEILAPFAKHNISLTSIETRPALPEKWAYVFFIDLEGHVEQDNVKAAIEEIRPLVKEVRVLGSYPIAVL
jgi:chorismate mutase / prephenate dehydratase